MSLLLRKITAAETLPLRQSVLRPGLPASESIFANDLAPGAGHYGVYEDQKLIAVGSVYQEACTSPLANEAMRSEGAWRLRGMATDPDYRSRGAGEQVLKVCLHHAQASGAKLVWAHARTGAVDFYLRHGLVKQGDVYEIPTVGPHFLMWINLPIR